MTITRATRHRRIVVTVMFVLVFGRLGVALICAGLTTMSSVPHTDAPVVASSTPAPPATVAPPIVGRPGASLGVAVLTQPIAPSKLAR